METNREWRSLIEMVSKLNEWESEYLPVPPTHVGRSLFLQLALSQFGDVQSMKSIYWGNDHASSGLRKTLRQLEEQGWVQRERSDGDHRCRTLKPTPEFQELVKRYTRVLHDVIQNVSQPSLSTAGCNSASAPQAVEERWPVLLLDSSRRKHIAILKQLAGFTFESRKVELIHAHTVDEATAQLADRRDIAVIIIGAEDAPSHGLDIVHNIRQEMANRHLRIILETRREALVDYAVLAKYDIDTCESEENILAQKLLPAIANSLRTYQDRTCIDHAQSQTVRLAETISSLATVSTTSQFAKEILGKLQKMLGGQQGENGRGAVLLMKRDQDSVLKTLSANGQFSAKRRKSLTKSVSDIAAGLKNEKASIIEGDCLTLCLPTHSGVTVYLHAETEHPLSSLELSHLEIFRLNAASVLDRLLMQETYSSLQIMGCDDERE